MNIKRMMALMLVIALILPNTVFAGGLTGRDPNNGSKYSEDGLLVLFEKSISQKDKIKVKNAYGLTSVEQFDIGVELMSIGKGADPAVLARALSSNKHVVFAHPDYIIERPANLMSGIVTNDELSDELWGLDVINAPEAWTNGAEGEGIVVAVIDSGIMIEHEDLKTNIWMNPDEVIDGVDNDGNGYVDDINGWNMLDETSDVFEGFYAVDEYGNPQDKHGTHVAGTIAGVANDVGVIGVAPKVKIMSLKFFGSNSLSGYTSEAIQAIEYATNKGADVINASWGGGSYNTALQSAIAAYPGIFVAASGNDGENTDINPHYPSSYATENIISVASSDLETNSVLGRLSAFSNYGVNSVDVAAPGGGIFYGYNSDGYMMYSDLILSTYPYDLEATDSTKYRSMGGTSMATPHVAGVVALMLSTGNYDASSSAEVIQDLLESTTTDPLLNGFVKSGGLLNALGAVTIGGIVTPPVTYTLTVEQVANGSISPTTSDYEEGTDVTLTATADPDYELDFWIVDGSSHDSSDEIIVTMDANHTVSAAFKSVVNPVIETTITYSLQFPRIRAKYIVDGYAVIAVSLDGEGVKDIPFSGYWIVDGVPIGDISALGVTNVEGLLNVPIYYSTGLKTEPKEVELVYTEEVITEDTTAPVLESSTPVNGASNVAVSTNVVTLQFDENVALGGVGTIVLEDADSTTVGSTVAVDGSEVTITILDALAYQTSYTLTVQSGAIEDTSGNLYGGTTVTFTTADALGEENTIPVAYDQSTNTPVNTAVEVDLSDAAFDADGDQLTYSVDVVSANGGNIEFDEITSKVTYTPDDGFSGTDTFYFSVHDGQVESNSAKVTIDVNEVTSGSLTWTVVDEDVSVKVLKKKTLLTDSATVQVMTDGQTPATGVLVTGHWEGFFNHEVEGITDVNGLIVFSIINEPVSTDGSDVESYFIVELLN